MYIHMCGCMYAWQWNPICITTKPCICGAIVYPEIVDDDSVDWVGHPALCVCTCLCIGMYACLHVCMFVYMFVCTYVSMYICLYVCVYACMYVCIYIYMYSMHVCMYVCIHVYVTTKFYMRGALVYHETLDNFVDWNRQPALCVCTHTDVCICNNEIRDMRDTCLLRNSRRHFCWSNLSTSPMCMYTYKCADVCMRSNESRDIRDTCQPRNSRRLYRWSNLSTSPMCVYMYSQFPKRWDSKWSSKWKWNSSMVITGLFSKLIWKKALSLPIEDFDFHSDDHFESHLLGNGLYMYMYTFLYVCMYVCM